MEQAVSDERRLQLARRRRQVWVAVFSLALIVLGAGAFLVMFTDMF